MNTMTHPITVEPPTVQKTPDVNSEFLRIHDVERLFSIKRGVLYGLISRGEIKSVNLRKRGTTSGLRLIHGPSLKNFLLSQAEGGVL